MVDNDAKYYPNNRSIVEAAGRGEISMGLVNHYYNYQEVAANPDTHKALNYSFSDNDIGSLLIITQLFSVHLRMLKQEKSPCVSSYRPVQQCHFTDRTFEYPLAAGVAPNAALPCVNSFAKSVQSILINSAEDLKKRRESLEQVASLIGDTNTN